MEEKATRSWSDIPLELAGLVLRRLPAHVDRVRFAAVCPQWRLSAREVRMPPPLPLLALPEGTVYSIPGSKPFRLPDCEGYTEACGNWLFFAREDGCFLRDPFSNITLTLPALTRVRVRHVRDEPVDEGGLAWMEMDGEELELCKVMFCLPQLIAALVWLREGTRVGVCQSGASWWSVCMDDHEPRFVDLEFYQGQLYALNSVATLFAVDISVDERMSNPWVSQIRPVISNLLDEPHFVSKGFLVLNMTYLVESRGALLVVCRKVYIRLRPGTGAYKIAGVEQNRFKVFQADFGQSRWLKMTTLGDNQVLFLRRCCSRSVCASHNTMPGDRIFFMDNEEENHRWSPKNSLSSCSVYDMRDGQVSTPLPMVSWTAGPVFATWLFPQN